MATVTIGTIGGTMTAAQLKTALDNAVGTDLTRQGSSNSRTYRCVDNLIIQGDTDAEGFTFICAPGKTVTFHGSAASPGVLRTSTYVDGTPFLPIRIIYEGETPFGEHHVTQETQGFLRNCGMDVGRLEIVITGDTTSNYYGVPFLTAQKTIIRELVVSNQNQSGLCYTNFNLTHAQSSVRISSIRNSTIRISSSLDFGFVGDAGWAFGEGGTQDIKLLSPDLGRIIGFSPKFSTSAGVVNLANPTIGNNSTRIFKDSFVSPSRITMHPTGNDATITEIERTVTYRPQAPDGSALTGVMARVLSTRTITGSPGVTAGAVVLHTGSVNTGSSQVFRVWKGFNAGGGSGAYQPATKVIDDSAMTIDYRQSGRIGAQVSISGYLGADTATAGLAVDADFTGTAAQAAAITGVAFAYDASTGTVAVSVTSAVTAQQIYNYWSHWTAQSAQMGTTMVPTSLIVVNLGVLTITGALTTDSVISGSGNVTAIKATGTITTTGSGSFSLPIEDSNGVRVTVRKSGGGNFNIAARYGTTGSYTDLGFQSDVSTVTYTVPKGQPVEVMMWSLGYVTYGRTLSTAEGGVVFDAEMTFNPSIDTTLDVSAYIDDIALSLDTSGSNPVFVVTFNAPMSVAGIELGKAVIHRLVGQEVALKSGFPPGSTATIEILADEIKNNLPAVRLAVGAGLSVTDRVYLDFFINTAPALVINPSYVINPVRADGNQVQILRAKPALDSSQLAAAVRDELQTELSRIDVAVSTRLATTAYTAPANADIADIKAKTDTLVNAPTVADIEASTVLAKEATVASKASQSSVTALGSPMQASAYVAPDNTKIAEIKTKVDTLQNTDLTTVNSGIADIKGTGFDATKHNLVKIKQQTSLAAALSA